MRKIVLYGVLAMGVLISAAVAYAADVTNDHARIESGETAKLNKMPWDSTYCRNVKNNNSLAIFVPYKTRPEWDAFVNYAPNKEISSCATTPPPYDTAPDGCGYCYYADSHTLCYPYPGTSTTNNWCQYTNCNGIDYYTWINNINGGWWAQAWQAAWDGHSCDSQCGSNPTSAACKNCLAVAARGVMVGKGQVCYYPLSQIQNQCNSVCN